MGAKAMMNGISIDRAARASLLAMALIFLRQPPSLTSQARGQGDVLIPAIIPAPVSLVVSGGRVSLSAPFVLWIPEGEAGLAGMAPLAAESIGAALRADCRMKGYSVDGPAPDSGIVLRLEGPREWGSEEYCLESSQGTARDSAQGAQGLVTITAQSARGAFCGVQTLLQLFTNGSLPALRIQDYPRFSWRGIMLDEARSFYGMDYVKRLIDAMAARKLNVLHWHLTDDQGWRVEIKAYPKLTAIGAWRGEGKARYGGFYTQGQLREIVAYASARFIDVVPEIDVPGHVTAAIAAYPEFSCTGGPFKVSERWGVHADVLCPGRDATMEFVSGVLSEVMDIFPSAYFHVGGDEVPKTRWKACPRCQARIKAQGLSGEAELQSWFTNRVACFLAQRRRTLIGWDEILDGKLPPEAVVQTWRGAEKGAQAVKAGAQFIASPWQFCYFCYPIGRVPIEKAYAFNPTAGMDSASAERCLGMEAVFFSEGFYGLSAADKAIWPRSFAIAERAWSPAERVDFKDFARRIGALR
jgi:hexosaminidase